MNVLPNELVINILSYLSFCNEEILNYKNSNKHFYYLCMKKINMKINNDLTLKNESLFQKVMRYIILNRRLIDQLEIEKMDMLIKQGWL